MAESRPTLHAIVQAAVEATGATSGWLLRVDGDGLVVVAAHAAADVSAAVGTVRPIRGIAGFVASSGQPAAVQVRPGDDENAGAGASATTPGALLAAPCGTDEIVAVIELADPAAGAFGFDDVETVTLIADIAGVAVVDGDPGAVPPSPAALGEGLARLAAADSIRYAAVARAVEALL